MLTLSLEGPPLLRRMQFPQSVFLQSDDAARSYKELQSSESRIVAPPSTVKPTLRWAVRQCPRMGTSGLGFDQAGAFQMAQRVHSQILVIHYRNFFSDKGNGLRNLPV